MPERRNYRKETEYLVEGTTARLAYLENAGKRNSEGRYTYRNGRGQRVTVSRNYARNNTAAQRIQEDYYDYVPVKEPQVQEEENVRVKERRQPFKRVDFTTLLVLCLVLGAVGYACYSYLSVQSEITALKSEIAEVEQQIIILKNENAERLLEAETNVDLKKVYRIATKELGMVHPKKDQVITYQSKQSDAVKQYGNIPEKKKSILEKILE